MLVEHSVEAIYLYDPETKRVLESNRASEDLFGRDAEELLGMEIYDLVAQDRMGMDQDTERALDSGHYPMGEKRYRRKDGTLVAVEASATTIPHEGRTAVCVVARDVTERRRTEKELQRSLNALLAIYEAGHVLGSTLETEEIGAQLLHLMQRISSSVTSVISLPDDRGQLRVWRAIGFENLWRGARFTPEVQATLQDVMGNGKHALAQVHSPEPGSEPLTALFLPLRIRNRTVGVLEVYGPEATTESDVIDILLNLTTKAASALENARLYGTLAERERQLQELVGKLLVTQEEERRRVAYEVHDGPTQVAVAAYQHLQAFARVYPPETPEGRKVLEEAVELARRTVGESRQIIASLRPSVLDDFGLATAIRLQVEDLHAGGWRVSYEEDLGEERVPNPVETTLYRVTQEALTNVRKHAHTNCVRIRLRRGTKGVRLQIRDWGIGFKTGSPLTGGPGEQIGLAGMRERVALVGGTLKIHSGRGVGTLITADVPLPSGTGYGSDDLVQRLTSAERPFAGGLDG
jgi:PAS domain S-box-containing protein